MDRISFQLFHESHVNGCLGNLENAMGVVDTPEEVVDAQRH